MIQIRKLCLENEVSLDLYLHVAHTTSTNFNRQLTFILAINLTKLLIKFLTGEQENRYTGGVMKICRKPLSLNIELSSCPQRLTSSLNRNRRKCPKVDASIFDSMLSHTRRSDPSEKKEEKYSRPFLDIFACGQASSPRLYRLRER